MRNALAFVLAFVLAAPALAQPLGIADGGTNAVTIGAAGSLAYSNGSAYVFSGVGGATNQLLHSGISGAPTWAAVNLSADVTSVLPIANGGTGSATKNFVDLTTNQSIAGNKTWTGTIATFGPTGGGMVIQGQQAAPHTDALEMAIVASRGGTAGVGQVAGAGADLWLQGGNGGPANVNGSTGNVGGTVHIQPGVGSRGLANGVIELGSTSFGGLNPTPLLILGASTSSIGFYDTFPTPQYNTPGTVGITYAGIGTPILSDTTYTGGVGWTAYTTEDVVHALKLLGLLAQ